MCMVGMGVKRINTQGTEVHRRPTAEIERTQPPPTKWTISRRSPSFSSICGQRSRGAMSRLSSTATRSDFMPMSSIKADSMNGPAGAGSAKARSSPLMRSFMGCEISGSQRLGCNHDLKSRPGLSVAGRTLLSLRVSLGLVHPQIVELSREAERAAENPDTAGGVDAADRTSPGAGKIASR